jgi:lysophospholipase L1-like esterase
MRFRSWRSYWNGSTIRVIPFAITEIHAMTRLLFLLALAAALGGLTPTSRTVAGEPRATQPAAEKAFFFKPGDRIVFLGDSITQQYQYSSYIELYLTTRMPDGNFTFLNAGIGGDTANGGAGRFQKHVLDEKPTAVTINFGMNDGGYGAFNPQANKVYVEKTAAMLDAAKKANVRVALVSPNAIDQRYGGGGMKYLETQKEFYAPLKGIAEKHEVPFVDQYAVTRTALEKMQADDPKGMKVKPFPDAVHTNGQGGLLMAHTILTGLNAPAIVSDASIGLDATVGVVTSGGKKCKLDDVVAKDGGVTFTRTDEAIPMPMQKDWLPMLPYLNEMKDLNYYALSVKGLKEGEYTISIDGVEVGKFSAKELAGGVNLGNVTTGPIWEQGKKVFDAINAKNGIVAGRFFGVVMFNAPDWLADVAAERRPAELKKRMEKIDAAQADIYKLAKPVAHKFEIKPAK